MRISDWSSDVCSSDLKHAKACAAYGVRPDATTYLAARERGLFEYCTPPRGFREGRMGRKYHGVCPPQAVSGFLAGYDDGLRVHAAEERSEEHTSELQSLMRISYAVFCLKQKKHSNARP